MLPLLEGAVADADRPRPLVAGQVGQRPLGQVTLAADPVHHLQLLVAGHLGDEVQEVVRLPVEAEGVEAPQREGRVPDPGVAVVPVPLPAGRLRQGGGGGRHHRAGRRVGQPLQRQGGTLQVGAPRMIRKVAAGKPVLPVVRRPDEALVGIIEGARGHGHPPRQRDEPALALLQHGAGDGARAFEADVQVAGQGQRHVSRLAGADALVVARLRVRP
jgi:hypothetical protein